MMDADNAIDLDFQLYKSTICILHSSFIITKTALLFTTARPAGIQTQKVCYRVEASLFTLDAQLYTSQMNGGHHNGQYANNTVHNAQDLRSLIQKRRKTIVIVRQQ